MVRRLVGRKAVPLGLQIGRKYTALTGMVLSGPQKKGPKTMSRGSANVENHRKVVPGIELAAKHECLSSTPVVTRIRTDDVLLAMSRYSATPRSDGRISTPIAPILLTEVLYAIDISREWKYSKSFKVKRARKTAITYVHTSHMFEA